MFLDHPAYNLVGRCRRQAPPPATVGYQVGLRDPVLRTRPTPCFCFFISSLRLAPLNMARASSLASVGMGRCDLLRMLGIYLQPPSKRYKDTVAAP